MKTVGQILKEEREAKYYTLDEIEKATKIRKELLEALEADEYHKLPPPTFVQGFIKNYGKFLDLDTEKLLAIFRREFSDKKNPPRILESFTNPIDRKRFKITPTKFLGGLVLTLLIIFFAYLWFEYRFLVEAPFLEIEQPNQQQTVESEILVVSGRTDPEAEVRINNQQIQVDIYGKFSQELKLTDGMNTIIIIANSKSGKESKIERTVFLQR